MNFRVLKHFLKKLYRSLKKSLTISIIRIPDEFVEVIQQTELYAKVPFKLDGPFTEAYFGKARNRAIPYAEFSQFLHDFHEECAMEAFKLKDPKGTGFITALDFQDIMLNVKNHLLTTDVKDNLVQVSKSRIQL